MEKKSILMWILIAIAMIPTIVGGAMKASAGSGKLGTGNFAVDFLIFSPLIAIVMFSLLIWLMMQPSAPKAPKVEEEPEEEEKASPEEANIEAEEKKEEPKEEIEKEEEEPKSKKKAEPEEEPAVTCPVCGKDVTLDDVSCPHCGAEFEKE